MTDQLFTFDSYHFDPATLTATFRYCGADSTKYQETVTFSAADRHYNTALLDRALFLCFIIIGTSYYKALPTPRINLSYSLDAFQADFFNHVYQEGLSQYAFENNLTRQDLAHFISTNTDPTTPIDYAGHGIISLQSGGKDSLLTATMLSENHCPFTPYFISTHGDFPHILSQLPGSNPPLITIRTLDLSALKTAHYNGHVPVTYINQSLALAQAILLNKNVILTSIGQEGNEPHAHIGDLPINHQWSKTWPAEQLFSDYVHRYLSPNIQVGSPLRQYSELKIAELFVQKCWPKYKHTFSSCNVANYRQSHNPQSLVWCGKCAKCANSYLLFAPFLPPEELQSIFSSAELFSDPELTEIFKGLLGVDNVMKPFECVGETAELRQAYYLRRPGYAALPFDVPSPGDYDYTKLHPAQTILNFSNLAATAQIF